MFLDPESYVPSLAEYFNLEFFGAGCEDKTRLFTVNDFIFEGEFILNDVATLFYKVTGEIICGTVKRYNGGIMMGMDKLPE